MIDLSSAKSDYRSQFALLLRDYETLLSYIEPTNANKSAYSHRIYELFIRACTEVESLSKHALQEYAPSLKAEKGNWQMIDYRKLKHILSIPSLADLDQIFVGNVLWRPTTLWHQPFEAWADSTTSVRWYAAYNSVKHNRVDSFELANLENLTLALSGLFLLLWRLELVRPFVASDVDDGVTHLHTSSFPFELKWEDKP